MNNFLKNNTSSIVMRLTGLRDLSVVFLICLSTLFVVGCKSTKKAQGVQLKEYSSAFLLKKLNSQYIDVEWFSAKAKISYKDDAQSVKANAYIRMRKDSVIWMAVKKLGVEAARILITTDSVHVLDRINKQYTSSDFSYIERQYHLPANFEVLQNLILGNPLFFSEVVLNAEITKERYHLASSNDERITSDYWLNGLDFSLEKMLFLDLRNNRKVEVSQRDQNPLDTYQNFSYLRSIDLSSPETGDVSIGLKLSDVTINTPKSIKFKIPEHYTKID